MPEPLIHLTVAAVVERQNRFLLVEERVDGQLCINQPAGHIDAPETAIEAVIRETLEETGYALEVTGFLGISTFSPSPLHTYYRLTFVGTVASEPVSTQLDKDIIRAVWLTEGELKQRPDLRSPLVLRDIARYRSGLVFPLSLFADTHLSHD